MFLITETITSPVEIITEEVDGKKEIFLTGVFLESERKNRNGRIYPKALLEREISSYKTNFIDTNRAFGELSHPTRSEIDPERISHLVTEIAGDGNNFVGKAKLLETPMGMIVKGITGGGGQMGISSRGMGSTKFKNGINEVQNDYDFVCLDLVTNPSGIDCFTEMVMEGEIWIPSGKEIIEELSSVELRDQDLMMKVMNTILREI